MLESIALQIAIGTAITPKMTITNKPTRLRKFISMSTVSEGSAETIYHLANILLLIAAVLVLVGTIGTIWGGAVLARISDLRISDNEMQTAVATESAAKANEGLAGANLQQERLRQENLKLALQLEAEQRERAALVRAVAPRSIESGQSARALKKYESIEVTMTATDDAECQAVAGSLEALFNNAGWKIAERRDSPPRFQFPGAGIIVQHTGGNAGLAAKELIRQLRRRSRVEVEIRSSGWAKLPPNQIFVLVQPNRSRYFSDLERQEWIETLPSEHRAQFEQMQKDMERIEMEEQARDEEALGPYEP